MPFFEQDPGGTGWIRKSGISLHQQPGPAGRTWRPPERTTFLILDDYCLQPGETWDGVNPPYNDNLAVHAGDESDLASIPPPLWGLISSYGSHTMSVLLHDRMCTTAEAQRDAPRRRAYRRWADLTLRKSLRDEAHLGVATRWLMWSAVRVFGVGKLLLIPAVLLYAGELTGLTLAGLNAVEGTDLALAPVLVATVLVGVAVLVAVGVSGVEEAEPTWWVPPQPQQAGRRFQFVAIGSLLGALAVGAVGVVIVTPVLVLTVCARLILAVLDLLLFRPAWLVARMRARRTTPAEHGAWPAHPEAPPAVGALLFRR